MICTSLLTLILPGSWQALPHVAQCWKQQASQVMICITAPRRSCCDQLALFAGRMLCMLDAVWLILHAVQVESFGPACVRPCKQTLCRIQHLPAIVLPHPYLLSPPCLLHFCICIHASKLPLLALFFLHEEVGRWVLHFITVQNPHDPLLLFPYSMTKLYQGYLQSHCLLLL